MASEPSNVTMNGTFVPTQPQNYVLPDQSAISHSATDSLSANPEFPSSTSMPNTHNNSGSNSDIPKDEVGWYFVEQYYTTMSRNPEKLYLFYNKRSQFVSGAETEKVNVCIGQKAVNDRIKELDIQDCKVRVTNVDSQGSDKNIVIQVIGEMSNKSAPQRKFTQTFVLAEQTNGYFVLNDIFRYIVEEEEEYEGEDVQRGQYEAASGYQEPTATAAPEAEPHTLTNSESAVEREHDARMVDQGLEQAIQGENTAPEVLEATVNGGEAPGSEPIDVAEDTPAAATAIEETNETTGDTLDVHTEDISQAEQPVAPEQTPAVSPPKPTPQPAAAAAPSKPAAPKTWANMVAANNKSTSAAPPHPAVSAPAPTAVPSQPKSTPSVTTPIPTAPAAASQETEPPSTPQSAGSEWQTAHRHDHSKKQPRPQATPAPPMNSRAYIKNIGDTIDQEMLRGALSKYGSLEYLDINRQKNCAFADFTTPAAYQAAVNANPHDIGGERIYVEERRVRPQSFGGYPRGGPVGRGRGSMDGRPGGQGRGGFKDGNRGGYPNRARGNVNARGRGVQQTA